MKNKFLPAIFILLAVTAKAQTNSKITEKQKSDAAKADVFITNSKQKITDSFTTAPKDSTVAVKKLKKPCSKRKKKSS